MTCKRCKMPLETAETQAEKHAQMGHTCFEKRKAEVLAGLPDGTVLFDLDHCIKLSSQASEALQEAINFIKEQGAGNRSKAKVYALRNSLDCTNKLHKYITEQSFMTDVFTITEAQKILYTHLILSQSLIELFIKELEEHQQILTTLR